MTEYERSCEVEASGLKLLVPHLKNCCFDGELILFDAGPSKVSLQSVGDAVMRSKWSGQVLTLEFKFERAEHFGNFFLETWSNRARFKPGWFLMCQADILVYQFNSEQLAFLMKLHELRAWAYQGDLLYGYPEKRQSKYSQRNDTWGRPIPISAVRDSGIKFHEIQLANAPAEVCDRMQLAFSDLVDGDSL